MSPINEIRRQVMRIAWSFFRTDRLEGFGAALRRSWAWVKKTYAKPCRITRQVQAGATHIRVSSLVRRRDRKHLGNHEARSQAMFGS